jgi:hypothetical protein
LARILEISDRQGAKVAKTNAEAADWETAAGCRANEGNGLIDASFMPRLASGWGYPAIFQHLASLVAFGLAAAAV